MNVAGAAGPARWLPGGMRMAALCTRVVVKADSSIERSGSNSGRKLQFRVECQTLVSRHGISFTEVI